MFAKSEPFNKIGRMRLIVMAVLGFDNIVRICLGLAAFARACACSSAHGLSMELVHRDSPRSPFYNPQQTHTQRLNGAFRRSMARAIYFSNAQQQPGRCFTAATNAPSGTLDDMVETRVFSSQGEYLMNLSIGTPPFEILAIADTGSDLIWTQCTPCTGCYPQKDPLFNPKASRTYKDLSCSTRQCGELPQGQSSCSPYTRVCQFSYSYGDQSFTNGNLGVDTLTLASTSNRPISFPRTVLGCGHSNDGTFSDQGSGIIGLGGGHISLVSQLPPSIGSRYFSYCLLPLSSSSSSENEKDKSSKINFGSRGVVSGEGVVSTSLVPKTPDTFYYLTLEAVTVRLKNGKITIRFSSDPLSDPEGNIIIDSGTTLSLVPEAFFTDLAAAVDQAVTRSGPRERVEDPDGYMKLWYKATPDLNLPVLTAHFSGAGADVRLDPGNTFVQVSDDVVCSVFVPTPAASGTAIYGNIMQMNFLVGYDLLHRSVSFKKTDCSKL